MSVDVKRPAWAEADDLMREYYDTEWGFPVTDTPGVFERLVLEGFQSGLSWATVLRKRPAFRDAFAGFDPVQVAAFDESDVERLMTDARIVRNERKIRSAITNAKATVAMAAEGVDLAELVWSFRPENPTREADAYPSRSAESEALSRELKRRGWVFVGPVTLYAGMEAMGVIEHRLA